MEGVQRFTRKAFGMKAHEMKSDCEPGFIVQTWQIADFADALVVK